MGGCCEKFRTTQSTVTVPTVKQQTVSVGSLYGMVSILTLIFLFKHEPNEDDVGCFDPVLIRWLNGIWIAVIVLSGIFGYFMRTWTREKTTIQRLGVWGGILWIFLFIRVLYCITQYSNKSPDGRFRYWVAVADATMGLFLVCAIGTLRYRVYEEQQQECACGQHPIRNQQATETAFNA